MSRVRVVFHPLACLMLFAWIGCSASEEAGRDSADGKSSEAATTETQGNTIPAANTGQPPAKVPSQEEAPPPVQESGTPPGQQAPQVDQQPQQPGIMMWSVQIGAFKQEAGAMQLFEDIKSKFNQPVYKDYDPVSGFYKITIGSFQTREQAASLKADAQAKGYPDAFTVEVRR